MPRGVVGNESVSVIVDVGVADGQLASSSLLLGNRHLLGIGMKADDVKRLKELEAENTKLKRIVADKELENLALREIAKGTW